MTVNHGARNIEVQPSFLQMKLLNSFRGSPESDKLSPYPDVCNDDIAVLDRRFTGEFRMVKKVTRRAKWREWTKSDDRELKTHSKARTPVVKISKVMKRTPAALRQRAFTMGMSLGHQR